MTCPHCGAANADEARFCGKCGGATTATEPVSNPSLGEAPVLIGREIAGRYRVLAKLGEGGMGAVFRAEQISLKRTVAIKLLRPDVSANQMLLRRFNAEAEAVAKLNHPNTVNIYDFGQDTDGTLFIAMELIDGRSLRSVMHAEAPLAVRRALAIAKQVAASLADAHGHQIVHRDLKPDNVMLQDRGRERDIARVLDFGIAKLRDDTRATQQHLTQQGDMLGTPQYMAPEQIRAEAIDGRTDVYALGCLLYEMVTGRLPHEAPTVLAMLSKHLIEPVVAPSQRRPELGLPEALDRLVLGAMAKSAAQRPATMDAFSEQLIALLDELPADPRTQQRSAAVAVQGGYGGAPTPAAYSAIDSRGLAPADPPIGPYGAPTPAPYGAPTPGSGAMPPYVAPSPYAPGAQPAAPYAPPYAPPYQPPDRPPTAPAAPPSKRAAVIAVIVLIAVAGSIAALVLADRKSSSAPHDAGAPPPPPGDASVNDPWAGSAAPIVPVKPVAPADDPWAGGAAAALDPSGVVDGTTLEVGEGVSVVFPPGFTTRVVDGLTAGVDARGVVIGAGKITVATNDPIELARAHAKMNHLTYESMQSITVGGTPRPLLVFRGTFNGVAVRHVAVPLIGDDYRVAVVFQAPVAASQRDPSIGALMAELYSRRIELP